jgi:hypothetical protein
MVYKLQYKYMFIAHMNEYEMKWNKNKSGTSDHHNDSNDVE